MFPFFPRRAAVFLGCAAFLAAALPVSAKPSPLQVVGTQIKNGKKQTVTLRGVNVAGMEWSSDGEGHVFETVQKAVTDWHVNLVRLPLAQDRWFGKAPEQTDGGEAYRALVKKIVDYVGAQNCYVLLDLHWSDANEWGKQIGQHVMPDENSVTFWKDCAKAYKNNPAVLFDLYNEPHDVTWEIWQNGGPVTEKTRNRQANTTTEKSYQAVGMQKLLDTVRQTGAKNVVVAGGLDWAYDLSGILDGHRLSDPKGNGIIYANHAYPFKGDTVAQWQVKMETATKTLPVIVSEWGSDRTLRDGASGEAWVRAVLQVLQSQNYNWTAWDLHPAAGPTLVSDWNYTPTPYFGALVKPTLTGQPLPPAAVPPTR